MKTNLRCGVAIALTALTLGAGCGSGRSRGVPRDRPANSDAGIGTTSGSGLPSSLAVASLDGWEVMELCEWSIETAGGPGSSTTCADGRTTRAGTVSECVESFSSIPVECLVTVGEMETCVRAVSVDPCDGIYGAACAPVRACGMGSATER